MGMYFLKTKLAMPDLKLKCKILVFVPNLYPKLLYSQCHIVMSEGQEI